MACKRTATSDLNHDNWNQEDEPEEAGTFNKAPQEVMEKRVVKSARRRLPRSGDGNTKSAFVTFPGFTTSPKPVVWPFKANVNTTASASNSQSTVTTSNSTAPSNGTPKIPENGTETPPSNLPAAETPKKIQESKKAQDTEKGEACIFKKSSDYFAKLKGLNEGVSQWIKSHVDSNPFCILTPIFRDYERYLKEIETKHGVTVTVKKSTDETIMDKPIATSSKLPSVQTLEKQKSELSSDKKTSSIFDNAKTSISNSSTNWGSTTSSFGGSGANVKSIFGGKTEEKDDKTLFGGISGEKNPFLNKTTSSSSQISEETDKTKSESTSGYMSFSQSNTSSATFSFGQSTATSSPPSAGFSFGSAKPFSFGSHVAAPQNTETKADNVEKEDEDEPPKPDFKPITEEDAFFEKRCKVFVKKDGNFGDRGIGVLFLKSTPNGKTQLIVRADNSLGNLLLNTLLTTSIPTKRMNKNTVMLVCLPLPDSEPPPTPVLLRVKTSEDADTLIETLDSNKK